MPGMGFVGGFYPGSEALEFGGVITEAVIRLSAVKDGGTGACMEVNTTALHPYTHADAKEEQILALYFSGYPWA